MSSHSDDHRDGDAVEAHEGAHDHHGFDPEPASEIADEEPRTPMWMPAVGVTLLVAFGLYVATGDDEVPTDEAAPAMTTWAAPGNAAEAPAPAKAPPPGPSPAQKIQQRLQGLRPGQAPGGPAQRPTLRPAQRPGLAPGAPGRPGAPVRQRPGRPAPPAANH